MIPRYPVYLFDVDGTLVDSATDICGAIQSVLASTPRHDVPDSLLRRYIGHHLNLLFTDLFPASSAEKVERLICEYRLAYPARKHRATKLFPGVFEGLASLPGRKSTVTTKGTPTTKIVLEMFGLLPFFDHVQGTDGFPAKPEPEVVLRAMQALNAQPQECLLIGDAAPDIEAGKRAGVHTCAVAYGYGDRTKMEDLSPDFWIGDLRELAGQKASHA